MTVGQARCYPRRRQAKTAPTAIAINPTVAGSGIGTTNGTSAAGRLPDVGTPGVVIFLVVDRAQAFAPRNVVGRVHNAIPVVLAGHILHGEVLVRADIGNALLRAVWPDDPQQVDRIRIAEAEVNWQIALIERARTGVGFAPQRHFLRRTAVDRGVERGADAGRVIRGAFQLDEQPMVSVGRGVVDVNALWGWCTAQSEIIRINDVQVAVTIEIAPHAIVTAGARICG